MQSTKEKGMYFIAITPNDRLQRKIHAIKLAIHQKYGVKGAFRSSGHITLQMPFTFKNQHLERLYNEIEEVSSTYEPFEINLDGFNAFPPRVIYIDVVENLYLTSLHHTLAKQLRKLQLFNDHHKRGFNPHITVAFRDLKKAVFYPLWDEYKNQSFKEDFIADQIMLYKHDGKRWNEFKNFKMM